jgi:hypothetical protein
MKQDIVTPLPPKGDPWRDNELVRRARIREDAERPMRVNLAEGIALSHQLLSFKGAARKS